MSQYFEIHPTHPQPRLIKQAVQLLHKGGVIAYPTDSCYAFGCHIGDKQAMERIRRIRNVDAGHHFTLVCRDLSEIAIYAKIDNSVYRLLKALTPGAYTFLLPATSEVPRRLQHPKRKSIGIRIPDNAIAQALLEELRQPLMSSTLILPDIEIPMTDAHEIRERLEHDLDLVIDGGSCGIEPTTVISMLEGDAQILRQGRGPIDGLNI